MTRISTVNDPWAEIRKLATRIRKLETAAPINHATVSRGALRVKSTEGLIVEGSAKITGILDGDGTLHWTGAVQLEGPVQIVGNVTRSGDETATGTTTLNGQTSLNGPTDITGQTDITGPTTITGDTTVQGDFDVTGGGTIQAGAVTITPASGGQVRAGSTTLASNGRISNSAGIVNFDDSITVAGTVAATNLRVSGASTHGSAAPNLYLDPLGNIWKTA
ncbi:hypothetical protein ABA31_19290 [Agrococcus baldri]|uniref:Polymer-forming protein n=2 Tax=Agrococcus baldri TaxID=153730 RepID=A0AA87US73_9MICO|nr:hypothetical protein ABA31_19290 [Agrococcus baldri]